MAGFGYDPELPDGFQEADFEMRELEAAAAAVDEITVVVRFRRYGLKVTPEAIALHLHNLAVSNDSPLPLAFTIDDVSAR